MISKRHSNMIKYNKLINEAKIEITGTLVTEELITSDRSSVHPNI